MAQQIETGSEPVTGTGQEGGAVEVAEGVAYLRCLFVNVMLLGTPGQAGWVLVDAGLPGFAGRIRAAAAERFGEGVPPAAIVQTHGHFDHVGVLVDLAEGWDVPVHAHPLELPYLNGTSSYPPPDPSVGGGAMALLSPLFPRSPVDVRRRLHALPEDGRVPGLPDWRWVHTPGHSVGHVSLWREADRTLVAGDAFVTTAQESAYAALTQRAEMHGPPMYFTHDWQAAGDSVRRLAGLAPEVVVTGHGPAMRGAAMRAALEALATGFDQVAVPAGGRYVADPQAPVAGAAYR